MNDLIGSQKINCSFWLELNLTRWSPKRLNSSRLISVRLNYPVSSCLLPLLHTEEERDLYKSISKYSKITHRWVPTGIFQIAHFTEVPALGRHIPSKNSIGRSAASRARWVQVRVRSGSTRRALAARCPHMEVSL
jgi:hypothetical protein